MDRNSMSLNDRWWMMAVLLVYVTILCLHGGLARQASFPTISLLDTQDTAIVVEWLADVGRAVLWQLGAFIFVGLAVSLTVCQPARAKDGETKASCVDSSWRQAFRVWIASVAIALCLVLFIVSVHTTWRPTGLYGASPAVGCLIGVWLGYRWSTGARGRIRLAIELTVACGVVCVAGMWIAAAAVQDRPLRFAPVKVTSAEKRRVVELLRHGGTRDAELRRLVLSEQDINLLLSWGLSVGSGGRKAKTTLNANRFDTAASIELRSPNDHPSYLNVLAGGELSVSSGHVDFRLTRLVFGDIGTPRVVLRLVSRIAVDIFMADRDAREAIGLVRQLAIEPGQIRIVARRGLVERHAVPQLAARLGAGPEVVQATREYVRCLVAVAPGLPAGDARFVEFVRAAFQLARERSARSNPKLENRAAIFALAMLLGHPQVEQLLGEVSDPKTRQAAAQRVGRVSLRGRDDWTRHFWVSAAVALISNDAVSDAVGLLKEELDAGHGGSGFSFSDLAADMSGTRFALFATHDDTSARQVQERLGRSFSIDDLFPQAADLPEGIPDAELQLKYGGVGGTEYQRILKEIERRISEDVWRRWQKP